jgi:hypothetical protein
MAPGALAEPAQATTRAAFRAGVAIHEALGAKLYAALCAGAADDAGLVELASHGQAGAQPMHLFSAVHDLLLAEPEHPLGRYYATVCENPEPPGEAFTPFARFCRERRAEILERLHGRTVQSTYVERCRSLLPPLSEVARHAGEPLALVEIGCSAGVLLTVDAYSYDLGGRTAGPADAPVALEGDLQGGPALRIPRIGARIGLDLHPVDVRDPAARRWVLALCFPELRAHQARLATALDVVARTDIRMLAGDALATLPQVLAETPGPLCVFHSTCLFYWPVEAKAALESLLTEASRGREIWRVGIEPAERFDGWYAGRGERPDGAQGIAEACWGEIIVSRYGDGVAARRLAARTAWDGASTEWLG